MLRIGISVTSSYTVADPREGAASMIARAKAAREADLDTLFVGDHHVTPFPYYQNNVILARSLPAAALASRDAGRTGRHAGFPRVGAFYHAVRSW